MNVPPVIALQRSRSRRYWVWWAAGVLVLALAAFTVANAVSYFRLGRDARALRNAVLEAAPAGTALKLEFSVGSWTFALARFATSFFDLEPDARRALEAVRSAEVGVYRFEASGVRESRATLFNRSDAAMSARGWERVVGVLHADKTVAVYVPESIGKRGRLNICVLTVTEHEMVIANVGGRVDPLVELVSRHLPERGQRTITPALHQIPVLSLRGTSGERNEERGSQ